MGTPKYDRAQLTLPGGFNGRDGVFRFLPDGRSEYALVIKQVTVAARRWWTGRGAPTPYPSVRLSGRGAGMRPWGRG